jgi:hypothetical protein
MVDLVMDNTSYIDKLRELALALAKAFRNVWEQLKSIAEAITTNWNLIEKYYKKKPINTCPKYGLNRINKLKHQIIENRPKVHRIRTNC